MSSQILPLPGKLIYISVPANLLDASEEACGRQMITAIKGDQFTVDDATGWFDPSWISHSLEGFIVGVDDRRVEADDRTLIALGERLAAALAAEVAAKEAYGKSRARYEAELARLGIDDEGVSGEALRLVREKENAVSIAIGHHAVSEAWNTVSCAVFLLCKAIDLMPVNTLSGLAVKGRATLYFGLEIACDATVESLAAEDFGHKQAMLLVMDIERLAKNASAHQLRAVA
jgi:hypothetical protein